MYLYLVSEIVLVSPADIWDASIILVILSLALLLAVTTEDKILTYLSETPFLPQPSTRRLGNKIPVPITYLQEVPV